MKTGVILLLRTGWSDHWCTPKYLDHPILGQAAAERIMATGVRVVGIDTFSPDETRADGTAGAGGFSAHEAILGCGWIIIENLRNLDQLQTDGFMVSFLPLNIKGGDGSPVRAVAWK
jgi:kynurenine formamidase